MLPATVKMVGLENQAAERGSLIPMYLPLPDAPVHSLYVPSQYRDMISDILEHLGIERALSTDAVISDEPSRLSVSVNRLMNIAVLDVEFVGKDFLEKLETHMDHLFDMRISSVYLDLPLSDPGTVHVGDHVGGYGFFFSALLPESGRQSDVLRLQMQNHEHVSEDSIKLASEWGARLLALCVKDRARVADELRQRRLSG